MSFINIYQSPEKSLGQRSKAWLCPGAVACVGGFGMTHLYQGDEIPKNTHDYQEVFVIISGSAMVESGRERHQAREGDIIHIPAGTVHRVRSDSECLKMLFINIRTTFTGV